MIRITLNFVISDAAAPSSTFCCVEISATYFVDVTLLVPGIGLSTTEAVDVQYNDEAPLGEWLNVGNIGGRFHPPYAFPDRQRPTMERTCGSARNADDRTARRHARHSG